MIHELTVIVGDLLASDACLISMLEPEGDTVHGSTHDCDQPLTSHVARPIRRAEQSWPSDFKRAIVTFGEFSRVGTITPGRGEVTFRVGIYVQAFVVWDGASMAGDRLSDRIYDRVIELLGDPDKTPWLDCCEVTEIGIAGTFHDGDVTSAFFDVEHGYWHRMTRFRWLVSTPISTTPVGVCP